MRPSIKKQQGFIIVSTLLSIPLLLALLLGLWGLSNYWLGYQQTQISTAAGALAGAAQLSHETDATVIATATYFCQNNSILNQSKQIQVHIGYWNSATKVFTPKPLPPTTPINAVSVAAQIDVGLPALLHMLSKINFQSIAVSPLTVSSSTSYLVR